MNIGIIGIGCIGSSLARDFTARKLGKVYFFDSNPVFVEQAEAGRFGSVVASPAELAGACDIIFVCVPVLAIPEVIAHIGPHLKPGAILTDVGSVKSTILAEAQKTLPAGTVFIPGHPLTADTIDSGPEAGRAGLFAGVPWILTPPQDVPLAALQTLSSLLQEIGAEIAIMDPDRHDLFLGFTSHLSHVIGFAFMNSGLRLSSWLGEDVSGYAGGSYKDLTRIAASDPAMWRDIFLANGQHLGTLCDLMVEEIRKVKSMIATSSSSALEAYIARAAEAKLTQKHKGTGHEKQRTD